MELRQTVGSPPQTTMRSNLRTLTALGILYRREEGGFPGSVDYQLTEAGGRLIDVAEALDDWLALSPDGPKQLGSIAARGLVKALIEGWSSSLIRVLAARPLALTQLDRIIGNLNYPTLERRLSAMRLAGQIRPVRCRGRGTPYEVTDWLRRAMAPLLSAIVWEREYLSPEVAAAVCRIDIEAAFLLAVPMLELSSDLSGVCRLAVEVRGGSDPQYAGVLVNVVEGRITSCVSRLQGSVAAWASGTPLAWFHTLLGREDDRLEFGGEQALATAVLEGLQYRLSALKKHPAAPA
jgi:DNA-binding HxlR family transcriptional regulator